MVASADRGDVAPAGAAASVVSDGVVEVAARGGAAAARECTGRLADPDEMRQRQRRPVGGGFPLVGAGPGLQLSDRHRRDPSEIIRRPGPRPCSATGIWPGAGTWPGTWAAREPGPGPGPAREPEPEPELGPEPGPAREPGPGPGPAREPEPEPELGPEPGPAREPGPGPEPGPAREPGPGPGARGPFFAQPCATARPAESVHVMHHWVVGWPASRSAMVRESSASRVPSPGT